MISSLSFWIDSFKKKRNLYQNYGSKGAKIFLLKWGFTIKF